MSGIRVRHATERNCLMTLVDGKRRYEQPFECPVCGRRHDLKTYHIRLDDTGTAIVAPEVWERLSRLPASGFVLVNAVDRPPPIGVSVDNRVSFTGSEFAEGPKGVTVRHPTLRSRRLVMVDTSRPYAVPYACAECGTLHGSKTYHLALDHEGAVVVSPEVAVVLERLGMVRKQQPEPVRLVHQGV